MSRGSRHSARMLLSPLVLVLLLGTVVPPDAAGRDPAPAVGIELGTFVPVGAWNDHRYADGVDMFRGGITVGGEVEFLALGLNVVGFFSYVRLNLDDWVDYARARGDVITASAAMYVSGLMVKHYVVRNDPSYLGIGLGLGFLSMRGSESFAGYSFDYNFLQDSAGPILGVDYRHVLSPSLALCVQARALWMIEGVKYADGEKHDVYGFPLTAGLRFLF